MTRYLAAIFIFSAIGTGAAEAAGKEIQDNSFLLEEAYNQEDGVIQHIQAFQKMKDDSWGYSFTEEWPAPKQAHQVSVTVPASKPGPDAGIGDVLLNYRYQALFNEQAGLAFSPRLSAVLPTGDYKKGLGSGAAGLQANLPLSVKLNGSFVTHWNMGATFIPGSKGAAGGKSDTLGFNYGASLIWLAGQNLNVMLEAAGNVYETVQPGDSTVHSNSFFINPGLRYLITTKSGLQIVPGFAFPIGVGPSAGERGVFAYLSFEHPMF